MRHKLSFKCEYCEDFGDHICIDRLMNHLSSSLYAEYFNNPEALYKAQETYLTEDAAWWEDQLGEAFWEEKEDEQES